MIKNHENSVNEKDFKQILLVNINPKFLIENSKGSINFHLYRRSDVEQS